MTLRVFASIMNVFLQLLPSSISPQSSVLTKNEYRNYFL